MREAHHPFPLTPALSLGERENRPQLVEQSDAAGKFEGRTAIPSACERAEVAEK